MMKTMLLAGASVLAFATSAEALTVFGYTGGWQSFAVTTSGVYQIKAGGAAGGASLYANGGRGVILAGDFTLNAGDVLQIGVGGSGMDVVPNYTGLSDGEEGAGGGGGSFVVGAAGALLMVAGGGGGGGGHSFYAGDSYGRDAEAGPNGSAVPFGGSGGINGYGGSRGFPSYRCSSRLSSSFGGGGGGWLGGGGSCPAGGGGGALGGGGGGFAGSAFAGAGGFGGGGGGGYYAGGGGGGGFSGGGGGGGSFYYPQQDDGTFGFADRWTGGGGGGSYNASTVHRSFLGYVGRGDGYVSISDVIPTAAPGVPEPSTWAMLLTGFGFAGFLLRRRRLART